MADNPFREAVKEVIATGGRDMATVPLEEKPVSPSTPIAALEPTPLAAPSWGDRSPFREAARRVIQQDKELKERKATTLDFLHRNPMMTPDEQAEVIRLSAATGFPLEAVKDNLPDVRSAAEAMKVDWRELVHTNPVLAEWLTDPVNSTVARDSVAELHGLQWWLGKWRRNTLPLGLKMQMLQHPITAAGGLPVIEEEAGAPQKALEESVRQVQYSMRAWQAAREGRDPELDTKLVELRNSLGRDYGEDEHLLGSSVIGLSRTLGYMGATWARGAEMAAIATRLAPLAGPAAPAVAPELATIGFLYGTALQVFHMEEGAAYDEYVQEMRRRGIPVDFKAAARAAKMAGLFNGLVEIPTEMLWLRAGKMLRGLFPGATEAEAKAALQKPTVPRAIRNFVGNWFLQLGAEAGQEAIQRGSTVIGREAAIRGAGGIAEFDRLPAEMRQEFFGALESFWLMTAPGAFGGAAADFAAARRAKHNVQAWQQFAGLVQATKLAERSPEKFQEIVEKTVQAEQHPDTVYANIDAFERYFQGAGVDPAAVAADVTGDPGALGRAKAAGAEFLPIPFSRFTAKIAPTPHMAALVQDVKFAPDEMTGREADAMEAQGVELLEAERQAAGERTLEAQASGVSMVYQTMYDRLLEAGFQDKAADYQAKLYVAAYGALSDSSGLGLREVLRLHPLPIINREGLPKVPVPRPVQKAAAAVTSPGPAATGEIAPIGVPPEAPGTADVASRAPGDDSAAPGLPPASVEAEAAAKAGTAPAAAKTEEGTALPAVKTAEEKKRDYFDEARKRLEARRMAVEKIASAGWRPVIIPDTRGGREGEFYFIHQTVSGEAAPWRATWFRTGPDGVPEPVGHTVHMSYSEALDEAATAGADLEAVQEAPAPAAEPEAAPAEAGPHPERWSQGREPVATIPGEPFEFLDAQMDAEGVADLDTAKAAVWEAEGGGFLAGDEYTNPIPPPAGRAAFETLAEAQAAAERWVDSGQAQKLEGGVEGTVATVRAGVQTAAERLAREIKNIRYGPVTETGGSVLFDFMGDTLEIPEPADVVLMGGSPEAAARWIAANHMELLAGHLRDTGKGLPEVVPPATIAPMAAAGQATGARADTFAFSTADPNVQYPMRYRVVSLDDLVTSHDDAGNLNPEYPQELQQWNRAGAASRGQVETIGAAESFDNFLIEQHALDRGTPIIGPGELVVESGNGRTIGLRKARNANTEAWQRYQESLQARAGELGLNVQGIEDPVLVRERTFDLSAEERVQFTRDANSRASREPGPVERARMDSERFTPELLRSVPVSESGTLDEGLTTLAGAAWLREFLGNYPASEWGRFVDSQGKIGVHGLAAVKLALFYRVFGSAGERVLSAFTEVAGEQKANLERALYGALPRLVQLRAAIETGELESEFDISEDMAAAADLFRKARQSGESVGNYLSQRALFGTEAPAFVQELARAFETYARRGGRLAALFDSYANAALRLPPPEQGGLFGQGRPSRMDLWTAAVREVENQEGEPALQLAGERLFQAAPDFTELHGQALEGTAAAVAFAPIRGPMDITRAVLQTGELARQSGNPLVGWEVNAAKEREAWNSATPQQQGALREMYQAATEAYSDYDREISAMARRVGGAVLRAPIKQISRVLRKANHEYGGDVRKVRDFLRATIVAPTQTAAESLIDEMNARFPASIGANGLVRQTKNNFRNPRDGYRDINHQGRDRRGFDVEIQVNVPEILKAKQTAHNLYEQLQALHDAGGDRDMTRELELTEKMRGMYDAAWTSYEARAALDPLAASRAFVKSLSEIGMMLEGKYPSRRLIPSASTLNAPSPGIVTTSIPESSLTQKRVPSGQRPGTALSAVPPSGVIAPSEVNIRPELEGINPPPELTDAEKAEIADAQAPGGVLETYTPDPTLTEGEKRIEAEFALWLVRNTREAVKRYGELTDRKGQPVTMGGKILNADSAKRLSPAFERDPRLAVAVQQPASALIGFMYRQLLGRRPSGAVLILAGGGGSGKSRSLTYQAAGKEYEIILDSIMGNREKALTKIELAHATGRPVDLVYVYRPVEGGIGYMVKRSERGERVQPIAKAADGHFKAQRNALELARAGAVDSVTIIDNSDGSQGVNIVPLEFLEENLYASREAVVERAVRQFEELASAGKVAPELVDSFTRGLPVEVRARLADVARRGRGGAGRGEAAPGRPAGAGGGVAVERYLQGAFHGTRKRNIERFSTDFVGTGEGAQSFGWGLYFAEARAVAEYYMKQLALEGRSIFYRGQSREELPPNAAAVLRRIAYTFISNDWNVPEKAIGKIIRGDLKRTREIRKGVNDAWEEQRRNLEAEAARIGGLTALHIELTAKAEEALADLDEQIAFLEQLKPEDITIGPIGQVYAVNLAPTDAELLDLDKDWQDQHPNVIRVLEKADLLLPGSAEFVVLKAKRDRLVVRMGRKQDAKIQAQIDRLEKKMLATRQTDVFGNVSWPGDYHATGNDLYADLAASLGSDEKASKYLLSLGIRGNVYLDQMSRQTIKGKPTRNFVIFDGSDVEILERYYQSAFHGGKIAGLEKLSTAFVGTGLGQARHGWGLYFAKDPAWQRYYQQALGRGVAYQVEIPDDNELLEADAGWEGQSPEIKALLYESEIPGLFAKVNRKMESTEYELGRAVYWLLIRELGSTRAASERLAQLGIPGMKYEHDLDWSVPGKTSDTMYLIWDDSRIQITGEGAPAFAELVAAQNDLQGDGEGPRGEISFDAEGVPLIQLYAKADLSTFLHESGHLYLRMLSSLATQEKATQQLRDDYATILNWMGFADDGEYQAARQELAALGTRARAGEQLSDEELRTMAALTDQLEKFARGFEVYLAEGRPPSAELAGPFARFRAWLVSIYRNIRSLGVELTDPVRAVMDRLLATEEQIAQAELSQHYQPIFSDAATAGVTEEEYQAYRKTAEEARQDARNRFQNELIKEKRRELTQGWREEREKVREDVSHEYDLKPVYQAIHFLRTGRLIGQDILPAFLEGPDGRPLKLSRDVLEGMYGDKAPAVLRRLSFLWTKSGGVHPDVIAPAFGFRSGDEMVQAIMGAKTRSKAIAEEVNQIMKERHGDILTDGRVGDLAMESVHTASRLRQLMFEVRALNRRTGRTPTPTPADILRQSAREALGKLKFQEIRPGFYQRSEAKAGRAAFAAATAGDFETALLEKQKQLRAYFLYLESKDGRERGQKARDYAYSLTRPAVQGRLGKAGGNYLQAVNELLEQYEFKKVTGKELQRRQSLREFYQREREAGHDVIIPPEILEATEKKNWKEMTLEELVGLEDSLRNITHLAGLKNTLLVGNARKSWEEAKGELINQLRQTYEDAGPLPYDRETKNAIQRAADALKRGDASLLKIEELVRRMDGGRVDGPWHRYVWNPIADAQGAANDLATEYVLELSKLFEQLPKMQRDRLYGEQRYIKRMGQSMTFQGMMAVAFQMGNDSNYKKMLQGRPRDVRNWDAETIEEILSHLSREDWVHVQKVWNLIHTLWPKIEALEKRLTGVAPPAVTPRPFTRKLADGTEIKLDGGYYPVVYDKIQGGRAGRLQATQNVADLFEAAYARAMTPHGHVIERVEDYAEPIKLDIQVVNRHLAQVIHDLTHREAVLSVWKVLADPDIRGEMYRTIGEAYTDQFIPWLKAVANDKIVDDRGTDFWTRFAQRSRMNAAMVGIGFRFSTMFQNAANFANSIEIAGAGPMGEALKLFLKDPAGWAKFVRDASPEMRHRMDNLERDIKRQMRNLLKGKTISSEAQRFAFYGIAMTDAVSIYPTWLAVYRREIKAGENEEYARRKADESVRLAFGAAGTKDLAAVQRGGELMKLLTVFYSYFSAIYNRQRAIGYDARLAAREGRLGVDFPRILARTFLIWIIPALLSELLSGRPPRDEEPWWHWAFTKALLWPALTIPFLRDVASAIEGGRDYKYSPAANVGEGFVKLYRTSKRAVTGEGEVFPVAKELARTSGYVFGLPTGQATTTADYLYDVWTGDEQPGSVGEAARFTVFSRPPGRSR